MNPAHLTNVLLSIAVTLLLVIAVQNQKASSNHQKAPLRLQSDAPSMTSQPSAPQSSAQAVNPMSSMILQALRAFPKGCEQFAVLAECDSADAQRVKAELLQLESQYAAPRELFDVVIAKYGEGVLTDQAKQIRAQVRAKKAQ